MTNLFLAAARPLAGRGLARHPMVITLFRFLCKLFVPAGVSIVEYDGFTMNVDRRSRPTTLIGDGKGYSPALVRIFKERVKPGMIVVDLGAAEGFYTLAAAKSVGSKGKVYAFEPFPKAFNLLVKNTERAGMKNIVLEKKAVSDTVGMSKLYLSEKNPLENSLGVGRVNPNLSIDVTTTTLDAYFKDRKVDLVKMNIEGAEPLALKGMQNLLRDNPSLNVITEFDPTALEGSKQSGEAFINELLKHFELQMVHMKKNILVPFEGVEQIREGLARRNSATYLICVRRGGSRVELDKKNS